MIQTRLNTIATLILTFAAISGAGTVSAQSEEQELQLEVNQQTTLPSAGVASYSVTGSAVRVELDRETTEFVLVARQVGNASLLLLYNDGRRVTYRISVGDIFVSRKDNIQLDFYFVQLAESYNHQIGVGWPNTFGANSQGLAVDLSVTADLLNGFSITGANATLAAQPLPRIDFLQSTGWARVMRQASVVTENGGSASINGGEEVNIVAAAGLTAQVQPIQAGANVSVTPRYDRVTGRIDLTVSAEMSDLTPSATGQAPGRIFNNIQTTVNLEMGQSLILGGLVADSESSSQTGVPFLSQIPILGLLFGTNGNRRNYSQTVIFIVPSIVDSVAEDVRGRINEALETYWNFSGDLDEIHFYEPAAGPSPLHPEALGAQPRDLGRRRGGSVPSTQVPNPGAGSRENRRNKR